MKPVFWQASAAAKAERILAEELQSLGWTQDDLAVRRKSDPAKLAIATRLRKETPLSIKQVTARVQLGTSKGANSNLHGWVRAHAPENRLKANCASSGIGAVLYAVNQQVVLRAKIILRASQG